MGYSISVRVKDKAAREKALAFMQREYREFSALADDKDGLSALRGPISGPLSYHRARNIIGFDYGPVCDEERQYAYCLLYWLALTVGDRRKFGRAGTLPYIVYDGHEKWGLVAGDGIRPKDADPELCYCLPNGWHPWWFEGLPSFAGLAMRLLSFLTADRAGEIIRDELDRLDAAWKRENPPHEA